LQGLQVDINHLNPGVRYKFIMNDGNIFSGNYYGSHLTYDTPPERVLIFNTTINETTGLSSGTLTIPVNFIIEIYAVVSAPSEKLPTDIVREINSYGGRINIRRKRNKTKSKSKKQTRKTKTKKLKR